LLTATAESAPPPDFELPHRQPGRTVRLADFAGEIVLLDFFAWWCAPCHLASRQIESGIQEYYSARGGNPNGVPVRVISVNIEEDFPPRTDAFIQSTGVSLVVNDFSGLLLRQFGAEGIPFIVILDGSASQPGEPRFQVAYQHAGFEGIETTRRIIDGLGADAAANGRVTPASEAPATPEIPRPGAPWTHTLGPDSEIVHASDIFLTDTRFSHRMERGRTDLELAFAYASFDMEYRPFTPIDFFGFEEDLREDRVSALANVRQEFGSRFTLLSSAGIYDGYPDYRRVWIANRYAQKYDHPDFPRIEGYQPPDPWGYNVAIGLRYEYLPATGFAELRLGYASDRTAPGYEDGLDPDGEFVLLRGNTRLNTASLTLASENILTTRLRVLNELSFSETTDRKVRLSYQGSLNLAVAERWVLRGYGGVSTEEPVFDAHYFGLTAEYEVLPNLAFGVPGRYYRDSGEIENSLPITSAAPPLRSWEVGAGVRFTGSNVSLKLYAAPFWTDYQPRRGIAEEFTYLYRDRNWVLVQLALSVQL
jgi:thiol-disulfide isomerase/thioredoxin